ncbi:Ig-like domain-containing protein, partial [Acinetobacter baumannii]|nr:Ig-like domain-containing protein [Acinetobacter baumannii]
SMPLDNRALAWSTADEQIATVENGTGIVRGVGNGETQITGKVGDFSGVLNVKVEIPEKEVMPIVKDIVAGEWALKQTGGKG